jgi:hypothetical protein
MTKKIRRKGGGAKAVCAETYQLVGLIVGEYPDLIPDAEKWLDNLSQNKRVHKDLLPVELRKAVGPALHRQK